MVAKSKMFQHVHDIHRVVAVLLLEVVQNADLLLCLAMEAFLVADHLEGDVLLHLVVVGLDHLAEAALANDLEHLVPVGDVIVGHVQVGAVVVVEAVVVGATDHALSLLGVRAHEVDMCVVEDLMVFEGGQLMHVLFHRHLRD